MGIEIKIPFATAAGDDCTTNCTIDIPAEEVNGYPYSYCHIVDFATQIFTSVRAAADAEVAAVEHRKCEALKEAREAEWHARRRQRRDSTPEEEHEAPAIKHEQAAFDDAGHAGDQMTIRVAHNRHRIEVIMRRTTKFERVLAMTSEMYGAVLERCMIVYEGSILSAADTPESVSHRDQVHNREMAD